MFDRPEITTQSMRQIREELQKELNEVQESIQLQQDMITRGGGFLSIEQCQAILTKLQQDQMTIKEKLQLYSAPSFHETSKQPKLT